MKALRFHGAKDLRLEDIPPPRDPGPGQVAIESSICGICGSDLHEYLDGPIFVPTEPHPLTGAAAPVVLGHEFSGRISAVGEDVRRFAPGDRVAIIPHLNKAGDYFVLRGLGHISDTTAVVGLSSAYGGLGERVVVPQENIVKIPDFMSDEQAALFEPMAVAVNAVDRGGIRSGDTVLVTGAGPIGVLAAMAAKAAGAVKVFVSEANPARRARLASLELGFEIVDPTASIFADQVTQATEEGLGVDVSIECAGVESALADCIRLTRRGGAVVQVGIFVGSPRVNIRELASKGITLTPSWGFPITIGPRVVGLIASGQLQPEKIITGRVGLADAVEKGFAELARPGHDHLKILVMHDSHRENVS